ncbi:hypothetical protein RUM44_011619 [Polyplax serrata]|uniref:Uncharacterized protein n=1 Tax=Polyplax serrata TaxID=468196 RepID=A0ABR1AQM3_POLSC
MLKYLFCVLFLTVAVSATFAPQIRRLPTLSPKSVPHPVPVRIEPVALPVQRGPIALPLEQRFPPEPIPVKAVHILNNTTNVTKSDFVFGARQEGDDLLLRTKIYKETSFWKNELTKDLTFPPPGSNLKINVTQVLAQDRGVNKTGGFIKIVQGGVGTGNVTLRFSSLKKNPINFQLEIYGIKK